MIQKYCLGFAFDHLGRVALINKVRPEWQRGRWNGIGGKLNQDELAIDAMRREFEEETGVFLREWELVGLMSGPGFDVSVLTITHPNTAGVTTKTDELVQLFVPWNMPHSHISNLPALVSLCRLPASDRPFFHMMYPYGKS